MTPTPLAEERKRLKDLLSTDGIIEDGIDAQYAVGFRAHAFEQALNDIADAILADGFRRPLPAVGLGAEERELMREDLMEAATFIEDAMHALHTHHDQAHGDLALRLSAYAARLTALADAPGGDEGDSRDRLSPEAWQVLRELADDASGADVSNVLISLVAMARVHMAVPAVAERGDTELLDFLERLNRERCVWVKSMHINRESIAFEKEGPYRWTVGGQGIGNTGHGKTVRAAIREAMSPTPASSGEAPHE